METHITQIKNFCVHICSKLVNLIQVPAETIQRILYIFNVKSEIQKGFNLYLFYLKLNNYLEV